MRPKKSRALPVPAAAACGAALVAALLLPAAPAARAQYTNAYTGRTWNNPTSSLLDTMILQAGQRQMLRIALERQARHKIAAREGADAGPAAPAAAPPSTAFRPSKEYVSLPKVADQLGRDDAERTALMQLLRAGMASYEKEAASDHRPHDVAEAMAFYVAVNYGVLHDGAMPDDKQTEGLYRSLHDGLLGVPAIGQATDRQKQALYEALVGIGVFTLAGYQQGVQEDKPETRQTFRLLAAANLKDLLSLPADRLRLTGDGTLQFVPAADKP